MTKKVLILLLTMTLMGLQGPATAARKLTLMLDWFPNVDHLPLYYAKGKGYFAKEGLEVKILSPSGTSDALKLAASGNVDIAVSYQPQTIIAAARGLEIAAFARLVEHPLTTLLFLKDKGYSAPEDLNGKRIGYTVPGLMDVLLAAFAKLNGIETYTPVNVGFTIVQSLSADKVDAIMGPFKTYETVTMAHRGYQVGYFELEKFGIPDYDELIFVAGKKMLDKHAASMKAFRRIIEGAIAEIRKTPQEAFEVYFKQVPEADRKTETEAFQLTLPYFAHNQLLDRARWQRFADFALEHGLIEKSVDVESILWK